MLPVAIIGGGPVGLASSILLSQHGIAHVVYERHGGTSIHPKACGLNQRTAELFRQLGVEAEVLAASAPPARAGRTAWYTALGPGGREICGRDAWGGGGGGGGGAEVYERHSPCAYVICPQIRLEPILQRRALGLCPGVVRYRREVVGVEEKEDRVVLRVRSRKGEKEEEDGEEEQEEVVEAKYVLVADGGRGITEQLGIRWEGERDIVDMITAHLRAPLRRHHPDPRNFITWFVNPELGGSIGSGYLYHVGSYDQRKESEAEAEAEAEAESEKEEEWVFACAMGPHEPKRLDEDAMLARFRQSVTIPDLPVDILSLSHWSVNAITAAQYRSRDGRGRAFLVGDAAHRIPPWGALGLNTGLQDVQNLIWKLALALRTDDGDGGEQRYSRLLSTYDRERRPIGRWVCTSSLRNLRQHGLAMDAALGLDPRAPVAANRRAMAAYFDPAHPDHVAKRNAVRAAQRVMDTEFHAPGAECGWFYPSVGAADGGEDAPYDIPDVTTYHPTSRPGHHLPHAWLRRRSGSDPGISTRDLPPSDRLLLLAGPAGAGWTAAGAGALVHVVVLGVGDGMCEGGCDPEEVWATVVAGEEEELARDGAVLVRPDGIVAWRARSYDPALVKEEFPAVVRRVLCLDDA